MVINFEMFGFVVKDNFDVALIVAVEGVGLLSRSLSS